MGTSLMSVLMSEASQRMPFLSAPLSGARRR
jgi:hypothetical protein